MLFNKKYTISAMNNKNNMNNNNNNVNNNKNIHFYDNKNMNNNTIITCIINIAHANKNVNK